MFRILKNMLLLGLLCGYGLAQAAYPQVEFRTDAGSFVIELYPDKAPKTVTNFLEYVRSGFYEGTVFHRVIDGFVVQGGGLTPELHQKKTLDPIPSEADNGLKNEFGTVAMARLYDPDSASAQFFINLADNRTLDFYKPDAGHMGYCVFGRVIRGMAVVEKISHTPTQVVGKMPDVPIQLVAIDRAGVLETPVTADGRVKPAEKAPVKLAKSEKSAKKGKKRG